MYLLLFDFYSFRIEINIIRFVGKNAFLEKGIVNAVVLHFETRDYFNL